ncbi:MAG: ABC transporter permease [Candidatus Rokuibacteriota bacterium]
MSVSRVHVWALQGATIGATLAGWELAARAGWVDPLFVPAPSAVVGGFSRIGKVALVGLAETLAKTAIAYAIAVVLGVGAGLAIGSSRLLSRALNPFVVALYGIPKILILPWIVLLLGFGAVPAIVYGSIHAFFPIVVLVMGGVRDVDRHLLAVAQSFGARPRQLYLKIILPAIVPAVVAGMRLGLVFSLLGVLIVEMFAGLRGMGSIMGSLANGFQAAELFAATALVSAVSITIVLALDALNERLSRWRG